MEWSNEFESDVAGASNTAGPAAIVVGVISITLVLAYMFRASLQQQYNQLRGMVDINNSTEIAVKRKALVNLGSTADGL